MSDNMKNWSDFAKNDWMEFDAYFRKRYPEVPFNIVKKEFAKKLGIASNVMDVVIGYGAGKVTEEVLGATVGNILAFADLIAQAGGLLFYSSANVLYGRTRKNPHSLLNQTFSGKWELSTVQLSEYVKFILYWYPKDRKAGYYGFRYGGDKNGVVAPLRKSP